MNKFKLPLRSVDRTKESFFHHSSLLQQEALTIFKYGFACSCVMFFNMNVISKKQYISWKNAHPHGVLAHHSCMYINSLNCFIHILVSFSFYDLV